MSLAILLTGLFLIFIVGFLKPIWIFTTSIVFSIVQLGWISHYESGNTYLTSVPLLISFIALLIQFLHFLTGRIRLYKTHVVTQTLLGISVLIIVHAVVSSIYNEENLLLSLSSYRYALVTLVAYNMALYYHTNYIYRDIVKLIIGIAYLQIPFSIAKYMLAGGGLTNTLDSVTGTLGGYGSLVACQVTAIALTIYDLALGKRNIFKLNYLLAILLLVIPLILSKSRLASLYIFIGMLIGLIIAYINTNSVFLVIRKTFSVIALLVIISGIMYRYFWVQQGYDLGRHSDSEFVWNYFTREGSDYGTNSEVRMGRLRSIMTSTSLISRSPTTFLLGYSPGSMVNADFLGVHGKYYYTSGKFYGLGRTQFAKTLMGMGILGLLMYLLFLKRIMSISLKSSRLLNIETANYASIIFVVLLFMSVYTVTISASYYSVILGLLLARIQIDQISSRIKLRHIHITQRKNIMSHDNTIK